MTEPEIKFPDNRSSDTIIYEKDGSKGNRKSYKYIASSKKFVNVSQKANAQTYSNTARGWLHDLFLPKGYPHSVSNDYLQYQIWDTLQAYSSFISNALSLHTTLEGLGVGSESASSVAAAMIWLIKDGASMISSIFFAYWKGSELDNNGKQWRLFADVVNDFMFFVKLCAPFLPIPFWLTLSFSSVLVSLVGVAGGATRASVSQHLAIKDNMAELSAKEGSQETLVNLFGLLTSLTILPIVAQSSLMTWTVFIMAVAFHLFCNYKAMKALQMSSLNRPRLLIILESYIKSLDIPSIEYTNFNEPMVFGPAFRSGYLLEGIFAQMGLSVHYMSQVANEFEITLESQLKTSNEFSYMIFTNKKDDCLYVIYSDGANYSIILESFFACYIYAINKYDEKCLPEFVIEKRLNQTERILSAKRIANTQISRFLEAVTEKGWSVDPLKLTVHEWRIEFNKKNL